jgi:hypothetical protein
VREKHAVIQPGEGEPFSFGLVSGRFKIGGAATGKRFAVAQLLSRGGRFRRQPGTDHAVNGKYSIDMDFESVPDLCGRFGLTFPEMGR